MPDLSPPRLATARDTAPPNRRPAAGARRPLGDAARPLAALVAATAVVLAIRAFAIAGADATLVVMGFDPDRARLIDSLLAAFAAAGAARVISGAAWSSAAGGLLAFAIAYAGVFRSETAEALGARGVEGRFDPTGWAVSLLTLVVVAGLVAAAASLLAGAVRRFVLGAAVDLRSLRRGLASASVLARPVALVVGVALVAVATPVFGDMVNYAPDVRMRTGGSLPPALTAAGGGDVGAGAGADSSGATSPSPSIDAPAGALASSAPWASSLPRGSGRLARLALPAPWTGGSSSTITVFVYTPPGYDASGSRRYPVAYEAPFGPGAFPPFLDGWFTSGTAPAQILVWVSEVGGPWPDSECANSFDGREHLESFVVDTLVPWVDAHYRTIARPEARATFGWSQGGFCAAMLQLRHPDVFGSAISLDGYYSAGIASNQTVNAWRPWGGNAAYEALYSPVDLASGLSGTVARRLFLVLAGDEAEPFYGSQLTSFDAELRRLRVPHVVVPDPLGHSWTAWERDLPAALRLVGLHEAALGVFEAPSSGEPR